MPCASDAGPGVFGGYGVAEAVPIAAVTGGSPARPCAGWTHRVCGGGELGCPSACTSAMCWLVGLGVRDFGILLRFLLVPCGCGASAAVIQTLV
jgi:hypothetical protein